MLEKEVRRKMFSTSLCLTKGQGDHFLSHLFKGFEYDVIEDLADSCMLDAG